MPTSYEPLTIQEVLGWDSLTQAWFKRRARLDAATKAIIDGREQRAVVITGNGRYQARVLINGRRRGST